MATVAVITGDIVNSTKLTAAAKKKMVMQFSVALKGHKFEFYRGDSFQVYVKNTEEALALVLQLRAIAKSYSHIHDIRASIGIGKGVNSLRILSTANSEAFVLSGRAFDQLTNNQYLQIQSENQKANIAFRIIAYYADFIAGNLTSKQAEVLTELLKNRTQAAAAKRLKKAQATINKHAQAAGWNEVEKILKEYKEALIQFNLV